MKLLLEELESRDLANATIGLNNGILSIVGDPNGDYLTVSQKTVNGVTVVETYNAKLNTIADFNANQVTSITFQASQGSTDFYNLTNLPSTQIAGTGAVTYNLNGGTGNDTLIGSSNSASRNFLSDPNGNDALKGIAGYVNIFAGKGTHTIATGSGTVQVYSILGTNDVINGGTAFGVLIVNATSQVTASKNEVVVTFFGTSPNPTSPFVLTKDVNGNGILMLQSQDPTQVYFTITTGFIPGQPTQLVVTYADSQGRVQYFVTPKSSVQFIAFFSITGVSYVTNQTDLPDVLYAKSGSYLQGGTSLNVLKIHSGSGVAVGRGTFNDLFAGPGGTSTLVATNGQSIFRNATDRISTTNIGVVKDDVVTAVPAVFNGRRSGNVGLLAGNSDYQALFAWLQAVKLGW